jgi:hypothetical protein
MSLSRLAIKKTVIMSATIQDAKTTHTGLNVNRRRKRSNYSENSAQHLIPMLSELVHSESGAESRKPEQQRAACESEPVQACSALQLRLASSELMSSLTRYLVQRAQMKKNYTQATKGMKVELFKPSKPNESISHLNTVSTPPLHSISPHPLNPGYLPPLKRHSPAQPRNPSLRAAPLR